jgi:hypothetical protein
MVTRLAEALKMPLRERNALLLAAGYAPEYAERGLDSPELAQVKRAIEFIVEQQEPYPAFVMNRRWDILIANRAAMRMATYLRNGTKHTNMVLQFFDPEDLRAVVVNWEEVPVISFGTCTTSGRRPGCQARALDQALRYPAVPQRWHERDLAAAPPPWTASFARSESGFSQRSPRSNTRDDDRRPSHRMHVPADDAIAVLHARWLLGQNDVTESLR